MLGKVDMKSSSQTLRISAAVVLILGTIFYLAFTGVRSDKSYYVTINELQAMGNKAYTRHLRVSGNVDGSVARNGENANFVLIEENRKLTVDYQGVEPPPDDLKSGAQALAIGTLGRDGVFHATQLQAKCASKYAPAPNKTAATPTGTASLQPASTPATMQ